MYTIDIMLFLSIMHHYLLWHYGVAFRQILHIAKNFFWFLINFFSLPQLLRSYFAPWKRITVPRGETFNLEDLAGFVIVNLISRLIGLILRSVIILTGLFALLLLGVGLVLVYCLWVMTPIVVVGCLYYSLRLIF